jgi:hypothetical protein
LYGTYVRTDSNIISKHPTMTDGKPASRWTGFDERRCKLSFSASARCRSTRSRKPTSCHFGQPGVYRMYFEALKWSLGLSEGDATPRPLKPSR